MMEAEMAKLLVVLLLAMLAPGAAAAQDALTGRTLFQIHCASCHGPGAAGDGLLVAALQRTPPDLTTLARRNGGLFPLAYVISRIDGSDRLMSDGDPMPVYTLLLDGPMLVVDTPGGSDIAAPEALVHVGAWLQSIQVE